MRSRLVLFLFTQIINQLPPDTVKAVIDDVLDTIENRFTDNDAVLVSIAYVRRVIDVPDDVGGDED